MRVRFQADADLNHLILLATVRREPTIPFQTVLVRAKHAGLLPAVGPALQALQEAGFRMVPALHHEALRLAGEVGH